MKSTTPLACPFCGAVAIGRIDGPDPARPFVVRCSIDRCVGNNASGHAEAEDALAAWNRRVQLRPASPCTEADLFGFTTKDLIRGELVHFVLDRTGVFTSKAFEFSPHSTPLMKKPVL